ncbi:tail length tape measure protein [Bacillus proteolyticus]|uniref:Tail length tape measure protein n=1 Tax=Bacillus proteolyticus TaxID=2026192 RepID=A0AA44KQH5_9BACI|nr:tail length tape measure protein [Bacillus proteolyticus]OJE35120.1 tail length tape measure protein [Bacillus proteolyticus]PGV66528.1 tail length tape measure protein [Bacillus cereus]
MIEKLTQALQRMRDVFAAVMIPIYNFISAIADLIIKFNEAHPVLARFIKGG